MELDRNFGRRILKDLSAQPRQRCKFLSIFLRSEAGLPQCIFGKVSDLWNSEGIVNGACISLIGSSVSESWLKREQAA